MPEEKTNQQPESVIPSTKKHGKGAMILMTVLGVIVVVLGIAFSGYIMGYRHGQEIVGADYDQKLSELGSFIPGLIPVDQEVKTISGNILTVSDNQITFEGAVPAKSILELNEIATFTAEIDNNAEIISQETSFEQPKQDEPPEIDIKTEKLSIGDLKEGDVVTFESADDIYGKTEFTAIKVIKNADIIPLPELPTP